MVRSPCPPPTRPPMAVGGRSLALHLLFLAAAQPVDEEPHRLRRPDLRPSGSVIPARASDARSWPLASSACCPASVYLINDVGTARPTGSIRSSRRRPIASGALSPAHRAHGSRVPGRSWRSRRRSGQPAFGTGRHGLPRRCSGSTRLVAQARRHSRRADHRGRIRAARDWRRRGDRRRVQPLAAAAHAAAGVVPRAEQAARRTGDAGRDAHEATGRAWRSTARTCSTR